MNESHATKRAPGTRAPTVDVADAVRALIAAEGNAAASKRTGVSVTALAKVAAGLPVRAGTLAVLREYLRGEGENDAA